MTQLSEHFTLAEMVLSQTASRMGLDNTPTDVIIANLTKVCAVMEKVRVLLGNNPISVTSGYRSPTVNAAVGGVGHSAHMDGLACDFLCPAFGGPQAVCSLLSQHLTELGLDQLIWEFDSWTHVGLSLTAPRHMVLTIDRNGTRYGLV